MNLLRTIDELPSAARGGAVSIGNFDGVHLGHAQLIGQLCRLARRCAGPAVVFTFEPHPARLLRPENAPLPLSWLERKAALLGELGVDWVVAYPTDRDLLSLEPDQFFDRIVKHALAACAMVEGPNFHFGKGRAGDVAKLESCCRRESIECEIAHPREIGGMLVSSSRIRERLAAGDVSAAAEMLGRPHRIAGMVERGAERGRTLGFPTANLGQIECLLPAEGVYACRALTPHGDYSAAVNVGPSPTFADGARKVEAHLLDFAGDLYGQRLEIDFVSWLRGVERFATAADLQSQLARDIDRARDLT